jgi:hypothetical protein
MSSQLATLVPVFDGTNYLVWSRAMKAYLQSQGLFGYTDDSLTIPLLIPAVAASPAVLLPLLLRLLQPLLLPLPMTQPPLTS